MDKVYIKLINGTEYYCPDARVRKGGVFFKQGDYEYFIPNDRLEIVRFNQEVDKEKQAASLQNSINAIMRGDVRKAVSPKEISPERETKEVLSES